MSLKFITGTVHPGISGIHFGVVMLPAPLSRSHSMPSVLTGGDFPGSRASGSDVDAPATESARFPGSGSASPGPKPLEAHQLTEANLKKLATARRTGPVSDTMAAAGDSFFNASRAELCKKYLPADYADAPCIYLDPVLNKYVEDQINFCKSSGKGVSDLTAKSDCTRKLSIRGRFLMQLSKHYSEPLEVIKDFGHVYHEVEAECLTILKDQESYFIESRYSSKKIAEYTGEKFLDINYIETFNAVSLKMDPLNPQLSLAKSSVAPSHHSSVAPESPGLEKLKNRLSEYKSDGQQDPKRKEISYLEDFISAAKKNPSILEHVNHENYGEFEKFRRELKDGTWLSYRSIRGNKIASLVNKFKKYDSKVTPSAGSENGSEKSVSHHSEASVVIRPDAEPDNGSDIGSDIGSDSGSAVSDNREELPQLNMAFSTAGSVHSASASRAGSGGPDLAGVPEPAAVTGDAVAGDAAAAAASIAAASAAAANQPPAPGEPALPQSGSLARQTVGAQAASPTAEETGGPAGGPARAEAAAAGGRRSLPASAMLPGSPLGGLQASLQQQSLPEHDAIGSRPGSPFGLASSLPFNRDASEMTLSRRSSALDAFSPELAQPVAADGAQLGAAQPPAPAWQSRAPSLPGTSAWSVAGSRADEDLIDLSWDAFAASGASGGDPFRAPQLPLAPGLLPTAPLPAAMTGQPSPAAAMPAVLSRQPLTAANATAVKLSARLDRLAMMQTQLTSQSLTDSPHLARINELIDELTTDKAKAESLKDSGQKMSDSAAMERRGHSLILENKVVLADIHIEILEFDMRYPNISSGLKKTDLPIYNEADVGVKEKALAEHVDARGKELELKKKQIEIEEKLLTAMKNGLSINNDARVLEKEAQELRKEEIKISGEIRSTVQEIINSSRQIEQVPNAIVSLFPEIKSKIDALHINRESAEAEINEISDMVDSGDASIATLTAKLQKANELREKQRKIEAEKLDLPTSLDDLIKRISGNK